MDNTNRNICNELAIELINDCFSVHQAQNRAAYYSANQLAQLRPSPRWATQGVRPQRK